MAEEDPFTSSFHYFADADPLLSSLNNSSPSIHPGNDLYNLPQPFSQPPVSALLPFVSQTRQISASPSTAYISNGISSREITRRAFQRRLNRKSHSKLIFRSSLLPDAELTPRYLHDCRYLPFPGPRLPAAVGLDQLPVELLDGIIRMCSLRDMHRLALTCRTLMHVCLPRIYSSVLIDIPAEVKSSQRDSSALWDADSPVSSVSTVIRSLEALERFIASLLGEELPDSCDVLADIPLGSLIQRLDVQSLGPLTEVHVQEFAAVVLPSLPSLRELSWSSAAPVNLSVLLRLSAAAHLVHLDAHVMPATRNLGCKEELLNGEADFTNLQSLSVKSLVYAQFAAQVGRAFRSIQPGKLERLILAGKYETAGDGSAFFLPELLEASARALVDFFPASTGKPLVTHIIASFLESLRRGKLGKLQPSELGIEWLLVHPREAATVLQYVDVGFVRKFSVANVVDVQPAWIRALEAQEGAAMNLLEVRDQLEPSFLAQLSGKLPALKFLVLDIHEYINDSIADFIRGCTELEGLDLKLRWSLSKLAAVPSWRQLCSRVVDSILEKHSESLKYLSICSSESLTYREVSKLIPVDVLLRLSKCHSLVGLRLHDASLKPGERILVSRLENLQYFDLFPQSRAQSHNDRAYRYFSQHSVGSVNSRAGSQADPRAGIRAASRSGGPRRRSSGFGVGAGGCFGRSSGIEENYLLEADMQYDEEFSRAMRLATDLARIQGSRKLQFIRVGEFLFDVRPFAAHGVVRLADEEDHEWFERAVVGECGC